ncbi:DUF3757 domain-containing protein [Yersinia nurmii]|uniref:DUF3757 domain-containing protein n=1 Tax=Yersinia nurmii TaxID=685706 RepID=A0AAW7K044_9GAMM|nr:DUF3757 domain-containing protein [Yersinia nurmii]MDN0088189.1 DUF3757 domain-containing protein [Yersinia nurmii]CNE71477.1 Protein of uncharacterised function (DUF3757) [Yersinia nurmii]
MRKINLATVLPIILYSHLLSASVSHCPEPNEIDGVHGLGLYSTVNSEWLGVSQGAENHGKVSHFLGATYFPYHSNAETIGILSSCSYALESGTIDMHMKDYESMQNGGFFVSLMGHKPWVRTPSTLTGDKFVCQSDDVKYCTFDRLDYYQICQYQTEDNS